MAPVPSKWWRPWAIGRWIPCGPFMCTLLPSGQIGIRDSACMAGFGGMDITVQGQGGHGSRRSVPQPGICRRRHRFHPARRLCQPVECGKDGDLQHHQHPGRRKQCLSLRRPYPGQHAVFRPGRGPEAMDLVKTPPSIWHGGHSLSGVLRPGDGSNGDFGDQQCSPRPAEPGKWPRICAAMPPFPRGFVVCLRLFHYCRAYPGVLAAGYSKPGKGLRRRTSQQAF